MRFLMKLVSDWRPGGHLVGRPPRSVYVSADTGQPLMCNEVASELDLTHPFVEIEVYDHDDGPYTLEHVGQLECDTPSCEDCYPRCGEPDFCIPDGYRLYGPQLPTEGVVIEDLFDDLAALYEEASGGDHSVSFDLVEHLEPPVKRGL
jgi:hypothetical protein